MLAEYFAPFPTATGCTSAVCTGKGNVSAEFCCLHAVRPTRRVVPRTASDRFAVTGFIGFTLPPELFQTLPSRSRSQAGFVRNHVRRWQQRPAVAARRASTPPNV